MAEPAAQQIPPATFTTLISMLAAQASVALGRYPNPATGKPEKNLPLAKHFIDTLILLGEKTSGNLTADESHLLTAATHDLRMAFLAEK